MTSPLCYKTVDGKTTEYLNDINLPYTQVLQTFGENDKVQSTYTYGVQRIKSQGEINETYLYDGHGSVSGVVTDSSKVINYSYTAYGDLMPDSPTPNTFGYNAEATDFNTGLQYLRARYYNTENGRFIQKDEYKGDFTQPSTLNRYAYCAGNPVKYSDPSGYRTIEGAGGASSTTSAADTTKELLSTACSDNDIDIFVFGISEDTPWWILNMLEKSEQHTLVQKELAIIVGGQTDVPIKGGARSGRLDTYGFMDVATAFEVWEVKPNSPYGRSVGPGQLAGYIAASGKQAGTAVEIPDIPYANPLTGESGYIVTTSGVGQYQGIVFYRFVPTPTAPESIPVVAEEPEGEKAIEKNSNVSVGWGEVATGGLIVVGVLADDLIGFVGDDFLLIPAAEMIIDGATLIFNLW